MSPPKSPSKFQGIFNKQPEPEAAEATTPERIEKIQETTTPMPQASQTARPVPTIAPDPAPGPALPTGMNFKLSPRHAEVLRQAQFRTGKTKQRIQEEALDLWIEQHGYGS